MFLARRPLQNIFSDKSSLVLRAMLQSPGHTWKIPELSKIGISFGMASIVLNLAESLGYVERVRIGPGSFSKLIHAENLLRDWNRNYAFDRNPHTYYHSVDDDFLNKLKDYCEAKKIGYALTLYSASRLISPYVKDDRNFVYLDIDIKQAKTVFQDLENSLGLLKLVKGGNTCLAVPYYRKSVFCELQILGQFPAVSNLQLYLDLMGLPPAGREEALHLLDYWKKRGIPFAKP
jgi:hypothetical protein